MALALRRFHLSPIFIAGILIRAGVVATALMVLTGTGSQLGGCPPVAETLAVLWAPLDRVVIATAACAGSWLGGEIGARLLLAVLFLAFECALLALLGFLSEDDEQGWLSTAFWLSPIGIYASYWMITPGLTGITLLILALAMIKLDRHRAAGAILGVIVPLAVLPIFVLPFLGLYYFGRTRLLSEGRRALLPAALLAGALCALMLAAGYVNDIAVHGLSRLLGAAANLTPGSHVYVFPLAYLSLCYAAWVVRRLDFDMMWSFVGAALALGCILNPTYAEWAIWALPFLSRQATRGGSTAKLLYWIFAAAFVAFHLAITPSAGLAAWADVTQGLSWASFFLTVMVGSGAALIAQILRRDIEKSGFYQFTRKPIIIGIGGDSGSGKDTLAASLIGMFGKTSVAHVSGDDYHLWDRQRPIWRSLTHLNPNANDLDAFARNVRRLASRRAVRSRHYDHATGKMTRPVEIPPREFIVASGLHALWSPSLNSIYDCRIFLAMEDDLRKDLKIERDTVERGHAISQVEKSMERRLPDSRRFIEPQAAAADLVIRVERRFAVGVRSGDLQRSLRLRVTSTSDTTFEPLVKLLVGLCGIDAIESRNSRNQVTLAVSGHPSRRDIAVTARQLAPEMRDLLALEPQWEDGLRGVVQLIVLSAVARACWQRIER